ncbi:MAG: cysteine hydrolase family protein [Chlamydiia bacterium]
MDPKKTALLIVDMQKEAISDLVKTGVTVISAVQKALQTARKRGVSVVYLVREHRASGIDVEKFRETKFQQHPFLVVGTTGAEVIEELKPLSNELIVSKQRFSGFFQSDLLMLLTRLGIESVVICGIQTPNCIRATAVDALAYDYAVTLLDDAIAAQTPEVHKANLFDMANMGATIQSVDPWIDTLK